jgi:hypothetical protein
MGNFGKFMDKLATDMVGAEVEPEPNQPSSMDESDIEAYQDNQP